MKKYFSIGETSEILKIPTSKLRYYDKKGLISPNIRKENGYRYYSKEQLISINKILIMRDLGFSLKDIKDFFNDNSCLSLKEKVKKDKKIIEEVIEKIKEEKRRLEIVEKSLYEQLELTNSAVNLNIGVPFIEEIPEIKGTKLDENINLRTNPFSLKTLPSALNKNELSFHVIKKDLHSVDKKKLIGSGYVVFNDKNKNTDFISVSGTYACILIAGKTITSDSVKKLADWIKNNNLQIIDDCFYVDTQLEVLGIKKISDMVHRLRILIKS